MTAPTLNSAGPNAYTGPTPAAGEELYRLIAELYPLCRSITGNGVRDSLAVLQRRIPLALHEVPSGTKVLDWKVPKEWNIRDAYIKNSKGERVVDFARSNLHVLNYSVPVRRTMPLSELKAHIFTLPDRPDWIPYRTSYYEESWGFCMSHAQLEALPEGHYEAVIDSFLENGSLTYGELYLPGERPEEVLFSCHLCHPSLCNDNLSGVAVHTLLAERLSLMPRRYSYRFLFIPGTIGSLTWLALNEEGLGRIAHGIVTAGVGDAGPFTYKKSRRGDAAIDSAVVTALRDSGAEYRIDEFTPYGYDERQYCSPGYNLPVGCLMRTPHGSYPEYHTSADNLSFVRPEYLGETFSLYLSIIQVLERNTTLLNLNPKGEPQLGRRGLYRGLGDSENRKDRRLREQALLWVLNLSDGDHSLLEIAGRAGLSFRLVAEAADLLAAQGLLAELPR